MSNHRFRCTECGAIYLEHDIPQWPGPDGVEFGYCDKCRSAESFVNICDELGCDREATCGWPSPGGYRRTCFDHLKRDAA